VAVLFLTIQRESFGDLIVAIHLEDEMLGKGVYMRIRIRNRVGETERVIDEDSGFRGARADETNSAFEG
jgi:hypothetical protein